MDEAGIVERFILARQSPNINYFALDLVCSDFEAERLAEAARKMQQANALGYFSEVIEKALLNGYTRKNAVVPGCDELVELKVEFPGFEKKRKSLAQLQELLYIPEQESEWEFLYVSLDPSIEDFTRRNWNTHLEQKWRIHAGLTVEEMADWLDRYFRGKTEEEVRGEFVFDGRTFSVLQRETSERPDWY